MRAARKERGGRNLAGFNRRVDAAGRDAAALECRPGSGSGTLVPRNELEELDEPCRRFLVVPGVDLMGPDRWPEVFGRSGLLDVEIGFGKDEFLLDVAESRPDGLYLAVDFSRPRTRSYLRKIELRGLTSVRVLYEHAAHAVGLCLSRDSVREYYVLCPDPWPKARHAAQEKNALLT